ncbi:hypothetical protein Glove_149g118 [Diversispora epigaea]|uniref:Uncharacterized protein n=1 Tax=Diversispora epigaea TaxID=1348612 RepID=A0A397IZZ1_9GLOM|nr:hypothetical protein Glove_149g118 [Diversispora epigaea]
MSTTIQNIDQILTEKKDRKFMQNYKKRYTELHEAEDPDIHVLDIAKRIFPNKEKYIESKKQYRECFPIITTPFSSLTGSSTNFTRIVIEWTNKQNITHIQMSTTIQNIDQILTEKKDRKFMQNYKKRYTELHEAEDPDIHVLDIAKRIFPNKEKYIESKKQYREWYKYKNEPKILQGILKLNYLYYQLAKNYFATNEETEKEADDFLNS